MGDVASRSLASLETSGYAIIRDFLSPAQLQALRLDYERAGLAANENYDIRFISPDTLRALREPLSWIVAHAANDAGIRVNTLGEGLPGCQAGVYFATEGGQSFPWHQDHESFFVVQEHYHYLNCYLPVIKPRRDRSNLCIVPFDALQTRSPEIYAHARKGGANRYFVKRGKTKVRDDWAGKYRGTLKYDLNELAVTPELAAGDLLLMRGDLIHRTQDADTLRVAASIRLMNRDLPLRLEHLLRISRMKWNMMRRNPDIYAHLLRAFRHAKSKSIPLERVLMPLHGTAPKSDLPDLVFELLRATLRV